LPAAVAAAAAAAVARARYIVEMEVVLPAGMTVRDSHDISLDLQHKVRMTVMFVSKSHAT
jgi:hypothetical protein